MKIVAAPHRRQRDNTLAYINVLLLILVFVVMSGTVIGNGTQRIEPADAAYAALAMPPDDAVTLSSNGTITWRGREYAAGPLAEILQKAAGAGGNRAVRIYADRDARASDAIRLAATLRRKGISDVALITARKATP